MPQIYDTAAQLVPTQEEFEKILTAKLSFETERQELEQAEWNKKNFNLTPWGIGYNLSKKKHTIASQKAAEKGKVAPDEPTAKLLRYFIIAVMIGWDALIDQLKTTLRIWGYTSEDLQQISKFWQSSNIPQQLVNAMDAAQNSGKVEIKEAVKELTEAVEKHKTLNNKLFTKDEQLKEIVRNKMLEIVDHFIENLKENEITIKVDDVLLIGSNASYNYTKDSDIDLHIVANTKSLKYPENLANALYGAHRTLFNKSFDINLYDIPLELYVETEDSPRKSNGVYSVKGDKWIKKPEAADIPEYDKEALKKLVDKWEDKCKKLISDIKADKLNDETKVVKLLEEIYDKLRKRGIAESEYSIRNLCFKELRNAGYLDELKEYRDVLISKRLSLEEQISIQNNFVKQDSIIKTAGNYVPQFTLDNIFVILDINERDFKDIFNNLAKLGFIENLTCAEQTCFDPCVSNHGVMPSKKYKIKGDIV